MSIPNEFLSVTSHTFQPENVTPLVIQAAHTNSNFPIVTNSNGITHFNSSNFFPNTISCDVAMLPFFHHTSQRPTHLNSSFTHQKSSSSLENSLKDEMQISMADGRPNIFNVETNNPSVHPVYWSRQTQLSPFGILPHEISPEHIEESKPYESMLNTHFTTHSLNNVGNHIEGQDFQDKKRLLTTSSKQKESCNKQYISKHTDITKLSTSLNNADFNHDTSFRNGVISHITHSTDSKLNQTKVTNANYKNISKTETIDSLPCAKSLGTVPRDYSIFKSPNLYSNSSVPVVKSVGKPSKQYLPKQLVNNEIQSANEIVKNPINLNSSPSLHQKISEFSENSQSSPISLTSEDLKHHNHYSSKNINFKKLESDSSYRDLNGINSNSVSQSSVNATSSIISDYREHQSVDVNCDSDKNRITPHFLKLPYVTESNEQSSPIITESLHSHRNHDSFDSLYIMYNNPVNVAAQSIPLQKRSLEKSLTNNQAGSQDTPRVIQATNHHKLVNISHSENASPMILPKSIVQNDPVGYSSVIMRTDSNYANEDKVDEVSKHVLWNENERQVSSSASSQKLEKVIFPVKDETVSVPVHTSITDQHQLMLGLTVTDQQQSIYNVPSRPLVQNVNDTKCSSNSLSKNVFEDNQLIQEQATQLSQPSQSLHQQISHNDQMQHYQQQYVSSNSITKQLTVNSIEHSNINKSCTKRRKSSKTNNNNNNKGANSSSSNINVSNNLHIMDNNSIVNTAEYSSRETPIAHSNIYQQQLQNSSYTMDMPKIYSTQEQFYPQSNLNSYNTNMSTTHETDHHQQSVILSHNVATPRINLSTTTSSQQNSQSVPLTAYFSTPLQPSSNSHFTHSDFRPSDVGHSFSSSSNIPNSLPSSENTNVNFENKTLDGRDKVIVQNVEEEFKFLFDSSLPNYKLISKSVSEDLLKNSSEKVLYYRKNINFLDSYIKFLENNCESVETLSDGHLNNMKAWNRNKVVYHQPVNKEKIISREVKQTTLEEKKVNVKTTPKELETNFENDPRYYPLPKSSVKRRLSNSDEESSTEDSRKKRSYNKKKSVSDSKKKSTLLKKQKLDKFEKNVKQSKSKFETVNIENVKSSKNKSNKLIKEKLKNGKLQKKIEKNNHKLEKLKPKMEKPTTEMKAVKTTINAQKIKKIDNEKSIPGKRTFNSRTKNKNVVKHTISNVDLEDELSNNDTDPSWIPLQNDDDDDCNRSKRRSTRIRSVRLQMKRKEKLGDKLFDNKNLDTGARNNNTSRLSRRKSKCNEKLQSKTDGISLKYGQFLVYKHQLNSKNSVLWRVKKDLRLQKFKHFEKDGKHLYRAIAVFINANEIDLNKCQETEAHLIEKNKGTIIVELSDDTDVPTDTKIKENFMKESLCYEHQFAVYIQTLVSQALDSNFLSEIVKENDVYFLSNVKIIDDVTASYLSDLDSIMKWGADTLNFLVKTWPFISVKSIRNECLRKTKNDCGSCKERNAKQTAIFYGQPYQRETLQGSVNTNIPNDMDKTVNLCKSCAREIRLYNKVWHQKYHIFVECAKYVSKKKSEDKIKGTTDILNELLADSSWLSKLFYDVRNTWLQIWTLAQKTKIS